MLAKMRGVSLLPLVLLAGCATRRAAAARPSVAAPRPGFVVDDEIHK
jgi:hypothetical protein